jgi:diguanylate cyclase (GGDEF)-like protein
LLLDSSRHLLMRLPEAAGAVAPGTLVAPPDVAQADTPHGAVIDSPLDQLSRLTATRRLALPWSPGADYWALQYGHPVADYRAGWRASAAIHLILSVMLLLLWWHLVRSERRKRALRQQARHAGELALCLVEQMPAAVALIERDSGVIAHVNQPLRQRFGPLAAPGQPAAGLFRANGDWVALQRAGQMDALPMLGRAGGWVAQAQCAAIDLQVGPPYWLLSLLDVTELRARLARQQDGALIDPLTGLANRRGHAEHGARLYAAARQGGQPLAVLALDLDNFKRINLRYGEAAGDVALAAMAALVRDALGPADVPARLGGAAFSVLMPGAELAQAMQSAERIRLAVAGRPLRMPDGQMIGLTISIGAAMLGADDADLLSALERADAALYRAKHKGRDRCEAA